MAPAQGPSETAVLLLAGGLTSTFSHMAAGWRLQFLTTWPSPQGCSRCGRWLSPGTSGPREKEGQRSRHTAGTVFHTLISTVAQDHFRHIVSVTHSNHGTVWEGTTQHGCKKGTLGSSWRLLTTGSQTELAPDGTSETSPFTHKPSSTIFHCSRWRTHLSIWLRQTLRDVFGFAPAVLLMAHPSAIPGSCAFKIHQDSDHCSSPPSLLSGLKSLGLAACSWIIAVAS